MKSHEMLIVFSSNLVNAIEEMERIALDRVSDAVIFMNIKNEEFLLTYYNASAVRILGQHLKTQEWFHIFKSQAKFLESARSCIENKTELSQTLYLNKEEKIPILFSFTPFDFQQLIITFR